MKGFASSFSTHLSADARQLERLGQSQARNRQSGEANFDSLVDFQKLSRSLGFFQLLKMAVLALVLFVGTVCLIFVDSFLF